MYEVATKSSCALSLSERKDLQTMTDLAQSEAHVHPKIRDSVKDDDLPVPDGMEKVLKGAPQDLIYHLEAN